VTDDPDDLSPDDLSPDDLEPDLEGMVLERAALLDDLDYVALLGIDEEALAGERASIAIRAAWHAFALVFHPDRQVEAAAAVRAAATEVFRRGAEAYRVLQDPVLRRRYLRRRAQGVRRMTPEEIADAGRASGRVQDVVRSAAARPFAVRADELIAAGDLRQARLQMQLVAMREPGNVHVDELVVELDAKIAAMRASRP
jgi:hypothetical protein